MTEILTKEDERDAAIRSLLRRAGHELRNAQSAAAVNIEVIRSRLSAGQGDSASLRAFSDNAAKGLEQSARLGESILALCGALSASLASRDLPVTKRAGGDAEVELTMSAAAADRWMADVRYLADSLGLRLERTAAGVILRIPPENETNRA